MRLPARRAADDESLVLRPTSDHSQAAALSERSRLAHDLHDGEVLRKLGLRDRIQAVVWACEQGLARPGA